MVVFAESVPAVLSLDCLESENDPELQDLQMMPVDTGIGIIGLLLKPTRVKRGQYQRVGCFFMVNNKKLARLERNIARNKGKAMGAEYSRVRTDKYGKLHHIIEIV